MTSSSPVTSTSTDGNPGRCAISTSNAGPSTSNAENPGCMDIQIFRPNLNEFSNFMELVDLIERKGAHKAGLAKIIPPDEWTEMQCTRLRPHDIAAPLEQKWKKIKDGMFIQSCVATDYMTHKKYKEKAESQEINWKGETLEAIEQKFWAGLVDSKKIYGADVSGSNFNNKADIWTLKKLSCILQDEECFPPSNKIDFKGITSPYLYYGSSFTAFAFHTEDLDLYSLNFHHGGAPKLWYVIPPSQSKKFEKLVETFYKDELGSCPAFIRHKQVLISPDILQKNGIIVNKIVQNKGEFIITFPSAYHAGFNFGYNCNEATNFASPRWINYAKFADWCDCKARVLIPIDTLVKKYQRDVYEDFLNGRDPTPHPEFPDNQKRYTILTSDFVKQYYEKFSKTSSRKASSRKTSSRKTSSRKKRKTH